VLEAFDFGCDSAIPRLAVFAGFLVQVIIRGHAEKNETDEENAEK